MHLVSFASKSPCLDLSELHSTAHGHQQLAHMHNTCRSGSHSQQCTTAAYAAEETKENTTAVDFTPDNTGCLILSISRNLPWQRLEPELLLKISSLQAYRPFCILRANASYNRPINKHKKRDQGAAGTPQHPDETYCSVFFAKDIADSGCFYVCALSLTILPHMLMRYPVLLNVMDRICCLGHTLLRYDVASRDL